MVLLAVRPFFTLLKAHRVLLGRYLGLFHLENQFRTFQPFLCHNLLSSRYSHDSTNSQGSKTKEMEREMIVDKIILY